MDPRITAVLGLVRQQPTIDLESLAAATNLSESRLRHLFKAHTSVPIGFHLKRHRLSAAELLLRETFLSVKQVSVAAGFATTSHFVREFRKAFGMPPAAYRQMAMRDNE
jgi:transcriptional regulator GlxA family with amidase domain